MQLLKCGTDYKNLFNSQCPLYFRIWSLRLDSYSTLISEENERPGEKKVKFVLIKFRSRVRGTELVVLRRFSSKYVRGALIIV